MNSLVVVASALSLCGCAVSVTSDTATGSISSGASEARGSATGSCPSAAVGAPSCQWPAAADTFDAGADQGCKPRPAFEECQVPNGSIILEDGGVETPDGEAATCMDLCCASEYALTCSSAPLEVVDGGLVGEGSPIPVPASTLNCRILPLPTPENALFYCCPCAP